MLSMAPVGSAGGAANYFAADNYYTLEESAEESIWYGEGAEMLGLAPSEGAKTEQGRDKAEQDAAVEPTPDEAVPEEASTDAREVDDAAPDQAENAREAGREETPAPDTDVPAEISDPDNAETAAVNDQLAPEGAQEDQEPANEEVVRTIGERSDGAGEGSSATSAHDLDNAGTGNASAAETPFDPERAGGLPEGVEAPLSATGQPSALAKTGNLPLTNPSGKVDAKTFENILNGKLPDGTQVGEPGKRALGMDLTFSMPKSASILALVGGDQRILEAHMGAVKSAMRWTEANLAEGRTKIDGRDVPVRTGNLVYALFAHDTSRSLDPQGHIHVVIANMTRMADGTWRALHNGQIWRGNTVISSIYHAAFREALEKIGYTVQLQGKHGTFEISGVPKTVRETFSQRREAILAKAAELGTATLQGLRDITAKTRDPKLEVGDRGALQDQWKEKAAALGFDPQAVISEAKARAAHQPGLIERSMGAIETALAGARTIVTETLRKPGDPLVDSGIKRMMLTPPEARTQVATASAIRILSQREAAFEVHHVTKTALDLGLAGVTPALIASRMTELVQRGELVPGAPARTDTVVTMMTTKEALATERGILAEIDRGKDSVNPLVKPERAVAVLSGSAKDRPLNDGQMAAASAIVSSSDRIVAVQGLAGTGKSTMLSAVANVLDFEKKPALGLAFQNKMVADLKDGTGLETMTVARFLMQHEKLLNGEAGPQAARSREQLGGVFLVVDEASMISNSQMHALVKLANLASVDRLVLVGDRQQLLSIDAGKSFAVSQAGGVATVRMDENLRQRTPQLRAVAALTNVGRAGAALKMLGDKVTESSDRVGDAAAYWLNLSEAERDKTMLFTSGREARARLNEAIQRGLREEGKLTRGGLTLSVTERVDRSREELRYAHSYEPGLRVEVWARLQSVGLERGEYRVARVFANGKVELERNGKRQSFDPQKLPASTKQDKMNLTATKEIMLFEGDKIRFTANDTKRDLLNSAIARIVGIDGQGIMVERADKSVVRLGAGDPMLKRIDHAYALNMHMAQGITTDKGVVVMGSEERFLSNQRLFNVAVTRVRDDVTVITDDKDKLARQLDRTSGDKYSALEEAGKLDVDRNRSEGRDNYKPFDPGSIDGLGLASDKPGSGLDRAERFDPERARADTTPRSDSSKTDTAKSATPLPLPEKSKGMEL